MKQALQNTYMARSGDFPTPGVSLLLTHKIETTRTIHAIHLDCRDGGVALTEAEIKTDIGAIEVRLNGTLIVSATATQIIDMQSYYFDKFGAPTLAGQLVIPFVRPNLPVAGLNRAFALGMISADGRPSNLTMSVQCTAGLTNLDGLTAHYEYDMFEPEPVGAHVRLLSHTRSTTATGDVDIPDMPVKGRNGVLAYHFVDGTGTMDSITVKHNNFDVFESTPLDLLNLRGHKAGRVPQTGYMHIDFAAQNDLANGLPLGDACFGLLLRPNYSVSPAGSFTVIEEAVCQGL